MLLFLQVNHTHLFELLARRSEPPNNLELAEKRRFFLIATTPTCTEIVQRLQTRKCG